MFLADKKKYMRNDLYLYICITKKRLNFFRQCYLSGNCELFTLIYHTTILSMLEKKTD